MISYAAGSRMLQLIGGVSLSFHDWYCDLPSASPETWGEQTDVQESADWYNAKLLAVTGSNLNMTRTPDCHFAAEARHNGTKMWVFAPDFNQVAKYADDWVAVNAGQDGAWWMAVNHVLLKEFHHDRQVPYFIDYTKKFTDAPYLVELVPDHVDASGRDAQPVSERPDHVGYRPGQMLRANRLAKYASEEHGQWKFLMWDQAGDEPKMPMGSSGFRWGQTQGKWNLELKDGADGSPIDPVLTFLSGHDDVVPVALDNFAEGGTLTRGVPVKRIQTADGRTVTVATVYDLLMAQYGVPRGLGDGYPADYNDADAPYTPAWSEKYTGMGRETLIRFAREWAVTAEKTNGKCTIIIGAGINHWYHANLMYRAGIHALMFCGCVGVNGGGLAHYVGQEKLAPQEPWSAIAMGRDWLPTSRLQNAPSFHYVHTDQWRYERDFTDYHTVPQTPDGKPVVGGHTIDHQIRAVRNGWLPFYPQFQKNSLDGQCQGARVFSEALPGHAHQHDRPGLGRRRRAGRGLARQSPAGQAGPGRGPELPHGHLGPVFGHRAAGGHLVRKGGPQLDRHAQLHSPPVGRRAAVLGVEERLADFSGDRQAVLATGRAALPRTGSRHRRRAAGPRQRGGDRPVADAGLDPRRSRGDSGQDDARPARGDPRLPEPVEPIHGLRPAGPR